MSKDLGSDDLNALLFTLKIDGAVVNAICGDVCQQSNCLLNDCNVFIALSLMNEAKHLNLIKSIASTIIYRSFLKANLRVQESSIYLVKK